MVVERIFPQLAHIAIFEFFDVLCYPLKLFVLVFTDHGVDEEGELLGVAIISYPSEKFIAVAHAQVEAPLCKLNNA